MAGLTESIGEAIRRRVASATIGTYVFFWLGYHWEGVHAALFTDEAMIYDKFHLLRNEYLKQYFFGWHGWSSILGYAVPLALTAAYILLALPYVLLPAYRHEERHRRQKREVKYEEEGKLQAAKQKFTKKRRQTLQEEQKTVRVRKKVESTDPQVLWQSEFDEFRESDDYKTFRDVLIAIYSYGGHTFVPGPGAYDPPEFEISPQALKTADVHGLVTIEQATRGNILALTEKGKFFGRLYERF